MCLSSCQSVWPTRLPRANIKNQFHHKGSMFSVNTMKLNSEFRTRDVTIVTPFSEFRYEANEKPWAKTRLAPSPLFLQPRKSFQQLLRCGWCTQRKAKRLGSRLCKNCLLLAWDLWQWTMGRPIEHRKENCIEHYWPHLASLACGGGPAKSSTAVVKRFPSNPRVLQPGASHTSNALQVVRLPSLAVVLPWMPQKFHTFRDVSMEG